MKRLILLFLLFPCTLPIASACYYFHGGSLATLNIGLGSVIVANDATAPVGSVLLTKSGTMSSFGGIPANFTCGSNSHPSDPDTNPPVNTSITVSGDGGTAASATYPTSIAGIGLKLYYYSTSAYQNEPISPTQTYLSIPIYIEHAYYSTYQNPDASIKVELIKTAPFSQVASGSLSYSAPGFLKAEATALVNVNISATVTTASCTVDGATPTTVDLGTVYSSSLPSVGSTANEKNFTIVLNCNAPVGVNIRMDATEDGHAQGKGVLALLPPVDGKPMAAGVGIQLLFNNAPLLLNQDISVGNATNGNFSIPLMARYYKTADSLTTGEVYASATYTLTYM